MPAKRSRSSSPLPLVVKLNNRLPVIAVAAGALLLAEPVTLRLVASAVLVLGGVALTVLALALLLKDDAPVTGKTG